MKVLVIGRGGREHAVIKKLMRDQTATQMIMNSKNII